jgi:hypothetical protein
MRRTLTTAVQALDPGSATLLLQMRYKLQADLVEDALNIGVYRYYSGVRYCFEPITSTTTRQATTGSWFRMRLRYVFIYGGFQMIDAEHEDTFTYKRTFDGLVLLVVHAPRVQPYNVNWTPPQDML